MGEHLKAGYLGHDLGGQNLGDHLVAETLNQPQNKSFEAQQIKQELLQELKFELTDLIEEKFKEFDTAMQMKFYQLSLELHH